MNRLLKVKVGVPWWQNSCHPEIPDSHTASLTASMMGTACWTRSQGLWLLGLLLPLLTA